MSSPVKDNASRELGPATRLVRAGLESDVQHGAVVPPIYLSSTYSFTEFGRPRAYDYSRRGNPTRDLLGDALASAEGGVGTVVTSTGMSAVLLALQFLGPDDLVVVPDDCYGGTLRLLKAQAERGVLRLRLADFTDPDGLAEAIAEKPRMVWIETPSNPLLRITDIRAVSGLAHRQGVEWVVVDNTFLSPILQRPLELGADLVVHSTTKYLNGHSDVVGGAVIAAREEDRERLAWWGNCLGLTGSAFDSYLTLRGLRTLDARLRVQQDNAARIVEVLGAHSAVERVYYPGLASHPGHAVAVAQQLGFGAMVSFELAGGEGEVRAFLDGLRSFSLAESLGGVESLVAHPSTMTHAAMDAEAQRRAGIGATLLRLSVGIEAVEDLCADIAEGLARASRAARAARVVASVAACGGEGDGSCES